MLNWFRIRDQHCGGVRILNFLDKYTQLMLLRNNRKKKRRNESS